MDRVPAMRPLRDLFDTPVLRVLRAMADGPLKMRAFAFLGGFSPKRAKVVRERLVAVGLIVVETPEQRTSTEMAIRATPEGLRIAEESARLLRVVEETVPARDCTRG